jgi:endogenous inhibitor of DNA gyrase (YacG/DUF329 family)
VTSASVTIPFEKGTGSDSVAIPGRAGKNRKRAEQRRAVREGRFCDHCGTSLTALRASRRFCSDRCRIAAFRGQRWLSSFRSSTRAKDPVFAAILDATAGMGRRTAVTRRNTITPNH